MPKNHGRRYTDQERASILADMEQHGLTQAAAAKKHGVSAVTIWQWRRAAGQTRRATARTVSRSVTSGSGLEGMLRSKVRDQIRDLLPDVVREEVADYMQQMFGSRS